MAKSQLAENGQQQQQQWAKMTKAATLRRRVNPFIKERAGAINRNTQVNYALVLLLHFFSALAIALLFLSFPFFHSARLGQSSATDR